MRRFISRREALVSLGGLVVLGCGSEAGPAASTSAAPRPDGGTPPSPNLPDAAVTPGPADAGAEANVADAALPSTPQELLAGIEAVVVVMMENRSFDHYLGSLKSDATYGAAASVDGLTGTESNLAPNGTPVPVFHMTNFTPEDPPHGWEKSHVQWNNGANDGFVKAHAGASENEVMGFHDRSQLPFYYWLADNFVVCDRWFASVMGPTWPNRFYLHACTSLGKKDNSPFLIGAPDTVWDRLKTAGKTFKNYNAGVVAWYTGGFVGKLGALNPVRPMTEFFDDAQQGTLPNFSIIDPDFVAADDHPSHDIRKGQVFVASVYRALSESPQWAKTLLIITYDEHGGFFDHVPPPTAVDPIPEFAQLGFRVPTFVIGGMVKKGHVDKTVFDHCSVAATLKVIFGIDSLGARMDSAASLASCIDPTRVASPASPPINMPVPQLSLAGASTDRVGESSQPELDAMIASGAIPSSLVDHRPHAARIADWLVPAQRLGAVRLAR